MIRRLANTGAAVAFLAALAVAILIYANDLRDREPARRHAASFGLNLRRPDVVSSVGLALSPDWAAQLVGDAALRDAFETVDLSNATPEVRMAWIESASRIEDELRSARGLLLDAIAVRPGWPLHQSMLGQVVLAENQPGPAELWMRPLFDAAEGAPAVDEVWQSLAAGYLQNWPSMSEARRAELPAVLRKSFADPEFVRRTFGPTAAVVGNAMVIACLPDVAPSLDAAFEYCAARGDIDDAILLRARWERAEWSERVRDLATIEGHFRRGDSDDVRTLSQEWVRRHPVWDFDSAAAHAQAARILELSPIDSEVARYLWTRNGERQRYAAVVARTFDASPNIARPTLAEAKLAAGEVGEAERLFSAAEDSSSPRWSAFLLALARQKIAAGDLKGAGETLGRVTPAILQTDEGVLTRRLLDRNVSATAPAVERATLSPCAPEAQIPIRGSGGWQTVQMRFTSSQPSLIDLGVSGARAATLAIDGTRSVTFRLFGFAEQTLWFRRVSGEGQICVAWERLPSSM